MNPPPTILYRLRFINQCMAGLSTKVGDFVWSPRSPKPFDDINDAYHWLEAFNKGACGCKAEVVETLE